MWDYGPGYWFITGVTMILFWGLIIVGIIALVRYLGGVRHIGRPDTHGGGPVRPEEILAERLARGEIDADEYKQRLDLLRERR
ncbi:SHOCT domain-containing protein [Actinoallomurus acanthiterrae]